MIDNIAAGRFEVEHVLKKRRVLLFTGQIRSVGNKHDAGVSNLESSQRKTCLIITGDDMFDVSTPWKTNILNLKIEESGKMFFPFCYG